MNRIDQFTLWLRVPLEKTTRREIGAYVDHLLRKRLAPKTIICHLQTLHLFFEYLIDEEGAAMENPIRKISIRLPKPLPRHLKDDQADRLFAVVRDPRDRAMFMLMLRCGLRVEEVAHLTVDAVDYRKRQVFVANGKGAKDRVVYLSDDARFGSGSLSAETIIEGEKAVPRAERDDEGRTDLRPGHPEEDRILWRKSGLDVSCHRLRHTFATQLLNADADLATIQDLLGHEHITTTQRYCRVANLKVQRDYYKAMELVLQRTQGTYAGRAVSRETDEERSHGWRVVKRAKRN